MLKGDPSGQF